MENVLSTNGQIPDIFFCSAYLQAKVYNMAVACVNSEQVHM